MNDFLTFLYSFDLFGDSFPFTQITIGTRIMAELFFIFGVVPVMWREYKLQRSYATKILLLIGVTYFLSNLGTILYQSCRTVEQCNSSILIDEIGLLNSFGQAASSIGWVILYRRIIKLSNRNNTTVVTEKTVHEIDHVRKVK